MNNSCNKSSFLILLLSVGHDAQAPKCHTFVKKLLILYHVVLELFIVPMIQIKYRKWINSS